MPIRVAIVEDDRRTREALMVLIDGTPGLSCSGGFGSVEAALRPQPLPAVDVMLLDIELPGVPGSEGVRWLHEKYPQALILMLTVFADDEKIFSSICNGASGYLLKKTPPSLLLQAIAEAHAGGAPMSPEVARRVVLQCQRGGPTWAPRRTGPEPGGVGVASLHGGAGGAATGLGGGPGGRVGEAGGAGSAGGAGMLSPQEVRVVGLLAEGHGYQAAADRLGISLNTVRDHVRNIYEKLHVHTRAEAVSKALRRGLLPS